MSYSSTSILALAIHFLINHNLLKKDMSKDAIPAQKSYRSFLISITAYYVTDAIWGLLYERGQGLAKNEEQAVHWLKLAAAQGMPEARKKLAGQGVDYADYQTKVAAEAQTLDENEELKGFLLVADAGKAQASVQPEQKMEKVAASDENAQKQGSQREKEASKEAEKKAAQEKLLQPVDPHLAAPKEPVKEAKPISAQPAPDNASNASKLAEKSPDTTQSPTASAKAEPKAAN